MSELNRDNIIKNISQLNSPCTLAEAVQIARAVAEDVLAEYRNHTGPLQVATSINLEIVKEVMIKSGLITEDEFKARYIEQVDEFNRVQQENLKKVERESNVVEMPNMGVSANDVEVQKF